MRIGDIVEIKGRRSVVMSFVGNGSGGRDVHCVRNSDDGLVQFARSEMGLDVIASPTFDPGTLVRVNGLAGTVLTDAGGDTVHVQIADTEKPLTHDPASLFTLHRGRLTCPAGYSFWRTRYETRRHHQHLQA